MFLKGGIIRRKRVAQKTLVFGDNCVVSTALPMHHRIPGPRARRCLRGCKSAHCIPCSAS
jgi:hypothetical protein